jgi:hypothetical protein
MYIVRAMRCGSQGNKEWVPNEGGNDGVQACAGHGFLALRSPVSDRILNSRCKVGLSQIAKSAGKLSIPYNFKMNK